MIEIKYGQVAVENLKIGDLVRTMDNGYRPIRWMRTLSRTEIARNPKLRPIRIKVGSLGPSLPERDLEVSPQHRMHVRSMIAQRMFGAMEVLVAAKQLLQIDGIDIADDLEQVTYVHFRCDDHQVVFANGAASKTLFTGPEALNAVGPEAREEIWTILPELHSEMQPEPAKTLVSGRSARELAVRHIQSNKHLVQ